jgi:hypothetical protein
MAWTRTSSLILSVLLGIIGIGIIVTAAMKDNKIMLGAGVSCVVVSAITYFFFTPEGYLDTKNSPQHAPIPNLRVESALDNKNHSLIIANRCNSIYGGAWQMGVQTECGRVRTNPNGFGF